jgi:ferredoxin
MQSWRTNKKEMVDENIARVSVDMIAQTHTAFAQKAAAQCPVSAITLNGE